MTSLHRAISLIEVNVVTMMISEDLQFNMSRLFDVLFNNNVLVVETLHCFSLCSIKLIMEILLA